jgi:hypothetical protein
MFVINGTELNNLLAVSFVFYVEATDEEQRLRKAKKSIFKLRLIL